jgi:NAD dependent epimerase/dehydratase family enzyme
MSWIHLTDLARLIVHAIATPSVAGPLNAVAPGACTNAEFTKALGRALHRPAFLPLPTFALRAMFGEVADVLTASQRCVPERALASGFRFEFESVDAALREMVG